MAKQDLIPGKQPERHDDGGEFTKQLKVDGTTFGVTAAEVTEAETAYNAFDADFKKGIEMDAKKQEQTKKTNKSDSVFVAIWRKLAKRIKSSAGYTDEGIGERYKIVGDEQTVDVENSKPALTAKRAGNGWEMQFNLRKFFDGVHIYRKKPGETNFTKIAYDTSSPYVDTDAIANGTEYYAVYVLSEKEVGLPGDVLAIKV